MKTTPILLLAAAGLQGQDAVSAWLTGLLPPEAKVIETADVTRDGPTDRRLVLWMLHPRQILREDKGFIDTGHSTGGCADWIYGDHWYGPARLSLLDLEGRRIINTIEITGMYEGVADRSFAVPFRVSNHHYDVPAPDQHGEGEPRILYLRDLTGEGTIGQFVLFEFEACELYLTAVLGYSPHADRAVHYAVETPTNGEKPKIVSWVEKVFGTKPGRPGYWDFTWEPGHGVDGSVRERVSFSRAKQRFVKK